MNKHNRILFVVIHTLLFAPNALAQPIFESFHSIAIKEVLPLNTLVLDVDATDGFGNITDANLSYSLNGSDAEGFTIDENLGEIRANSILDWDFPTDANSDNIYELSVTADNSSDISIQELKIIVFPENAINGEMTPKQIGSDIDGEAANDRSGYSVSISAKGDIVAIGAPQNDENGNRSGHARVYQFNDGIWNQLGSDIDGDATDDHLGKSVSLSADGQTVAVGATVAHGSNGFSGHVRVYSYDGNNWIQVGTAIEGKENLELSGASVSLSADGSIVAIGATQNSNNGRESGTVRIYSYNGTDWFQLGTDIDGEVGGDYSGGSVSLSADGQTIAIGAGGNDGNGSSSGHVRVYVFNGHAWIQVGSDIDGEMSEDYSGNSVSLSADGRTVAIGADGNNGNGAGSGHARIFSLVDGAWVQLGDDINGESSGDNSGNAVSLSADGWTIAIGASGNGIGAGHVRIYSYKEGIWTQVGQDLDGEEVNSYSGNSISLSADAMAVAIGAHFNGGNGEASGHTRIYRLKKEPEITFEDINTVYGTSDFSLASTSTSSEQIAYAIEGVNVTGTTLTGTNNEIVVLGTVGHLNVRASQEENEEYWSISKDATIVIDPKSLSITGLTGDDKIYDGTLEAMVSGTSVLSGVVEGDQVTLSDTPVFTFGSIGPGEEIEVRTTGYTLEGEDASNYTLVQPTLSANIIAVLSNNRVPNELYSLYPNPMKSVAHLVYSVKKTSKVDILLLNMNGSVVDIIESDYKIPGKYSIKYDVSRLRAGIYLCRMHIGKKETTSKWVVLD